MSFIKSQFKRSPIKTRLIILFGLLVVFIILLRFSPSKQIEKRIISKTIDLNITTVTEIIDGDTFRLSDSTLVRLIGIDTPEKGQAFYDEAVALAESVLIDKPVSLIFNKEKSDRYKRSLAYLKVDSLIFNELVLERGLANVYLFSENQLWREKLISAQKRARMNNLGLWSVEKEDQEEYYIRIEGSFRFHRPLCISIKNSKPSRKIKIPDIEKTLDLGYSPCRNCRP